MELSMKYEFKGSGLYDNEDFSFIKEHYDVPTNVENGTCWIGDENTFNEIINNIMESKYVINSI